MDYAVKVRSLPKDLEFPPELRSRIRFDPAMKQLVFHGFMSKADYDRLTRLHSDLEYLRAVERLFQISTDVEQPLLRRFGQVLAVLAVLCVILAAIIWWQLLRDPTPSVPSSTSAGTDQSAQELHMGGK